jgi:hypothetical protein
MTRDREKGFGRGMREKESFSVPFLCLADEEEEEEGAELYVLFNDLYPPAVFFALLLLVLLSPLTLGSERRVIFGEGKKRWVRRS